MWYLNVYIFFFHKFKVTWYIVLNHFHFNLCKGSRDVYFIMLIKTVLEYHDILFPNFLCTFATISGLQAQQHQDHMIRSVSKFCRNAQNYNTHLVRLWVVGYALVCGSNHGSGVIMAYLKVGPLDLSSFEVGLVRNWVGWEVGMQGI